MRRLAPIALAVIALAACGGSGGPAPSVFGFELVGADVHQGKPVPTRFTCDGADVSPTLQWHSAVQALQSSADPPRGLAVVVEDPDAQGGTFTHWLVYGLPPDVLGLQQGVRPDATATPGGAPLRQGRNDFGTVGYRCPCPPNGQTHRYVFRVLALDAPLELPQAAGRKAFDAAVKGHVLAEASLEAPYTRAG